MGGGDMSDAGGPPGQLAQYHLPSAPQAITPIQSVDEVLEPHQHCSSTGGWSKVQSEHELLNGPYCTTDAHLHIPSADVAQDEDRHAWSAW